MAKKCSKCDSKAVFPEKTTKSKKVSFTDPSGWENQFFVEWKCQKCAHQFATVLPGNTNPNLNTQMSFGDVYSLPTQTRGIGFRHPGMNYVPKDHKAAAIARNRRKKTAGIEDIKSSSREVTNRDAYRITEIDLKLEEE